MDPPIAFPNEWYPVAAVVLSGVLVAMVTSVVSWKLISWIRNRKRRYHEPLLSDGWSGEGKSKVVRKFLGFFYKEHSPGGGNFSTGKRSEEDQDEADLQRSSTIHSRTSLISTGSSSRASSIPPMIIQNCQPPDIHIPERRPSGFSVESGGVELGQVQAECYKSELNDGDSQTKLKCQRSKLGANSSINEAAEDAESEDEKLEEDEEEDDGENSFGSLMFSLEHDMHRESLTITIIKASDLRFVTSQPAVNSSEASTNSSKESVVSTGQPQGSAPPLDPYVRILLLPDGKQKAKTRIVRRTRNPVFEETFTFYGIGCQKLTQIVVKLSVMCHDRFAKDAFLGQVVLPLTQKLMRRDRHAVIVCRRVVSPNQSAQRHGEIFISLNFDPSNDKLTVVVLKGRNFPRMDISGLADPYVKVYLICDGQRVDKKKTQVKKRTLNPTFNETFHFTIPPHHQHNTHTIGESSSGSDYSTIHAPVLLRFVVIDWDRMSKNEVIGKVEIGPEAVSEMAVKHWNDIMECPRKQLAVWHKLE